MITKYQIDMTKVDEIIKKKGLAPGGKIQKMLTNEVKNISDPYVPFSSGPLKNLIYIPPSATYYEYVQPYARYHWYGKLMVDPITGKGAFFSEDYGFWSRPKTQKVLTDRDLQYQGAPQRGPKWTERAWAQHGQQVIANLEKELNR